MKIAVLNSKGGVGKSTVSVQVAAIYLHLKFSQTIHHYEFDDENEDSKAFLNTQVMHRHIQKVGNSSLRDTITDVLLEHEHQIFDVGANKTTTFFLEGLIETGLISKINLFIIPLMDGESDATSAIKMYKQIKNEEPNAKILFALNRFNSSRDLHAQFNIFLGDKRGVFNDSGLIEDLPPKDRHFITMVDSDAVKYSKNFGMTIWELGTLDRDMNAELKEAVQNNASKETIKMLSFKKGVKDDCTQYINTNIRPAFSKIEIVLGG